KRCWTGRTKDSPGDRSVEPPLTRHALQDVGSRIFEREPGARNQILDRLRDEDFPRSGQCRDASAGMDGDPFDTIGDHLDLTRVDPGPDLHPHVMDRLAGGDGAPDGSSGTVERCEEPVTPGIDLVT